MKTTTTKKRVCVMCKTEYSYCPVCSRDEGKPEWMTAFCGDVCHDVYEALNNLGFKKITEAEAIAKLKAIDLTGTTFPKETQKQIDTLLVKKNEAKVAEKSATKTTKPFIKKDTKDC